MASLRKLFFAAADYAIYINNHSNTSCRIAAEYHVMNRLEGIGRQVACKREATRSRYASGMPIDVVGCLHAAPA
jgi:hypothetical protein